MVRTRIDFDFGTSLVYAFPRLAVRRDSAATNPRAHAKRPLGNSPRRHGSLLGQPSARGSVERLITLMGDRKRDSTVPARDISRRISSAPQRTSYYRSIEGASSTVKRE